MTDPTTGRPERPIRAQAYHRIVASLQSLEADETLLVQSGKAVGIFKTRPDARPALLIANAMLVPAWGDWEHFRKYEARGLTMYGQMTGSWIYIRTQGILQGTYETFGACAAKHFGGSLVGRLVVSAGLGGMGGAEPLAVTLNGGVGLFVEIDRARIEWRLRLGYVDRLAGSLADSR